MSSIVVFGASGQLGHCIKVAAETVLRPFIHFIEKKEASILDVESLRNIFNQYKPDYCINCAAYTAVDKAEDDEVNANLINKIGVENLSRFCKEYNSALVHISTDFVFEGNKAVPLTEQDETNPVNVYGVTKLNGEKAIQFNLTQHIIIRAGWLYSEFGNNFVKTMLKLGSERMELKVIADQIGTPTYAMDLANCIFTIIDQGSAAYGVYHFSNEGVASWYDFAKAIFDIAKTEVKILPVKTAEYVTKARRPAYSLLDKSKIKKEFNVEIPYWRDSLAVCIGKLQKHSE